MSMKKVELYNKIWISLKGDDKLSGCDIIRLVNRKEIRYE